jgi:hypothetical protein
MATPIGTYASSTGKDDLISAPFWAKKLGRTFKALFNPDSPTAMHPASEPRDSLVMTGLTNADSLASMANAWRVHQTRKSVYQDIERMDSEDEMVATALDIIADCSVSYTDTSGFHFKIRSDDAETQKVLHALEKRLDLHNEIWQICRDMVKNGNDFREVVIDRQTMKIVAFKQTISYQIYPKTNKRGDKLPGWVVKEDGDIYMSNGKELELEEWQICPFIFGSKKGFLASPPLAAARRNWIRLTKMEDGMAVARLIRAYDKMVHRIPVKPEMPVTDIMNRIRMYKDSISKRRILDSDGMMTQVDNNLDVQTDFYLPDDGSGRGGVDLLSANNTQLGNLNDIIYHREKLLTRLQVPIAYLQITTAQKTHIASGASSQKADVEIQFARMLRRVQRQLLKGIHRLCDLELMLNGITPERGSYKIEVTEINTVDLKKDADIELTYAQAAVFFVEAFGALPPELIAEKFMHLDNDQQKLLDTFLKTSGARLTEAKIKGAEAAGQPKPAPGSDALPKKGTGNSTKNRAARSGEQKGTKQSIPLEAFVDVMYDLAEGINEDFRNQGIEVPELDESHRNVIRANLASIIQRDNLVLE